MDCPKCAGPMWDNRERKKNPRAPDYKCKDPGCDGVIWPPRTQAAKTAAGPGLPTTERGAKWTWAKLSETYQQSMLIARKSVVAMATALKVEWTMEDLLSATATIFIAAS